MKISERPTKTELETVLKQTRSSLDKKLMNVFKQLNSKIVVNEKNMRHLSKRKEDDREMMKFELK